MWLSLKGGLDVNMAKVNIIDQKKKHDIGIGSIVRFSGSMYVVISDYSYKLLNIETGELNDKYYPTIKSLNKDDKIQLISNEFDIVIK